MVGWQEFSQSCLVKTMDKIFGLTSIILVWRIREKNSLTFLTRRGVLVKFIHGAITVPTITVDEPIVFFVSPWLAGSLVPIKYDNFL